MIERGRSLKIENNVEESGFSGDQESSKELKWNNLRWFTERGTRTKRRLPDEDQGLWYLWYSNDEDPLQGCDIYSKQGAKFESKRSLSSRNEMLMLEIFSLGRARVADWTEDIAITKAKMKAWKFWCFLMRKKCRIVWNQGFGSVASRVELRYGSEHCNRWRVWWLMLTLDWVKSDAQLE